MPIFLNLLKLLSMRNRLQILAGGFVNGDGFPVNLLGDGLFADGSSGLGFVV